MNFYKAYDGFILFDEQGYTNCDGKFLALHLAFEFHFNNGQLTPVISFKLKEEIENENLVKIENHELFFDEQLQMLLNLIFKNKNRLIEYGNTFKINAISTYIKTKIQELEGDFEWLICSSQ